MKREKSFIPFAIALNKGHTKIQNARRTCTTIPNPLYNFRTKKLKYGTLFIILKSNTASNREAKKNPKKSVKKNKKKSVKKNNKQDKFSSESELRASSQLKTQLKEAGLKIGYNKEYNVYIDTSTNGWDQEYLLAAQVAQIARGTQGKGTILQVDNWSCFQNFEEFIKPLLLQCIFPC